MEVKVQAYKYETKIYESVGDMVHGMGIKITEIYIPNEKIIFNKDKQGKMHVFESSGPRGNLVGPVHIQQEVIDKLRMIVKLQNEIDKTKTLLLDDVQTFF
jgi:hypothetical protein